MKMLDCTAHITRPMDGPNAGKFVINFHRGDKFIFCQVEKPERKNYILTLLRKAGRTARCRIQWDRIFDGNSLTIYIDEPAEWFWSK